MRFVDEYCTVRLNIVDTISAYERFVPLLFRSIADREGNALKAFSFGQ